MGRSSTRPSAYILRGDSAATITAKVASTLLFAFPLFIVSVRHWASGIYILICLIAIPSLRRGWQALGREERIFVGIILAYLTSTIASNTMSGWTYASVRWYQADMRFLFAIPLFLFLRLNPNVAVGLLRALPFAGIYVGIQAIYDTFIGVGRVGGPYGPIFFGDIAALTTVLALTSIRYETYPIRIRIPLHVFGTAMGLVAVVLSGTRNAWFATVLALPLALVFALAGFRRGRKRFLAVLVGLALAVVALGVTEAPYLTKVRFSSAIGELTAYYQTTNQKERDRIASTPVGFRLEQWRLGLDIFKDRPLLGHGVGNVGKEVNRHVEAGRASRVLYSEGAKRGHPTHLHSAYLDALTHKGIIGLLALLAVLSYPAYVAIRLRQRAPTSFGILIVHAVAFCSFALTEDPFIRNNFSSVFLIFTTSLLTLLSKEAGATYREA